MKTVLVPLLETLIDILRSRASLFKAIFGQSYSMPGMALILPVLQGLPPGQGLSAPSDRPKQDQKSS